MLANSTINYTIFRNVEILKNNFFQITKYCEGKYEIFRNIPFFEMNISKLINYPIDLVYIYI